MSTEGTLTPEETAFVTRIQEKHFPLDGDMPASWKKYPQATLGMARRFCVAWKWDEAKTSEMLEQTLAWRKSFGTNKMGFLPTIELVGYDESELRVLYDRPEVDPKSQEFLVQCQMHKSISGTFYKWDKFGHPIWFERTGRTDCVGLVKNVLDVTPENSNPTNEVVRAHTMGNELGRLLCLHQSLKLGRVVDQVTVIMDLDGLGWSQLYKPALDIIRGISEVDQAHYPEGMFRLFLVNAPTVATAFWNVIKYWLNERTQKKVVFLGSDFKSRLLEDIDEDCLPEILGGTCKDDVPLPADSQHIDLTKGAVKVTVAAGSFHDQSIALAKDEVGCWEFVTESNDVSIGVSFLTVAECKIPILPDKRVDSHKMKITGDFTAVEDGTLVLHFDNSYSSWTSKNLTLRLYNAGLQTAAIQSLN